LSSSLFKLILTLNTHSWSFYNSTVTRYNQIPTLIERQVTVVDRMLLMNFCHHVMAAVL